MLVAVVAVVDVEQEDDKDTKKRKAKRRETLRADGEAQIYIPPNKPNKPNFARTFPEGQPQIRKARHGNAVCRVSPCTSSCVLVVLWRRRRAFPPHQQYPSLPPWFPRIRLSALSRYSTDPCTDAHLPQEAFVRSRLLNNVSYPRTVRRQAPKSQYHPQIL